MKEVRCIYSDSYNKITKGKEYEAFYETPEHYRIINDIEEYYFYPKYLFEVVEDSIEEATSSSLADQVRALELENQELKLKLEQIKNLLK